MFVQTWVPCCLLLATLTVTAQRASAECPRGTFDCGDGHCIEEVLRCDGDYDCSTNLDEEDCPQNWCPETDSMCEGRCLPQKWRCDGERQCSDGTDEESCDACSQKNCTQGCKSIAGETLCYCHKGFRLLEDGVTCRDINECADGSYECEQSCVNTPGSYRCSCAPGYSIADGKLCRAGDPEPLMLYCDNEKVYGIWMRSNRTFFIHAGQKRARVVDFDGSTNRVYWAGSNQRRLYSCRLDGTDFKVLQTASKPSSQIDGIAFDWVTNNIYIADRELKTIEICTTDGTLCVPIITTEADKPRALALRPEIATMYWTDWGSTAAIMRADMDGSNIVTLVNTRIEWPNGLAYDRPTNRLYWCDGKRNTIEYLDLTTMERKLLLRRDDVHPFSLAVFESTAYWSDWTADTIDMFNKYDGSHQGMFRPRRSIDIMGISIYHPVMRPTNITNPCETNPCDDICALSPNGFRCICSNGSFCAPRQGHVVPTTSPATESSATEGPSGTLESEGPSQPIQYQNDTSSVYVADTNVLYHIQHSVSLHRKVSMKTISLNYSTVVAALAYDSVLRNVYISDITGRQIMRLNGLTNTVEQIHYYRSGTVPGMDFDVANRNLYWVNSDMNTVEVSRWDGKGHVVLLSKLRRPYDVALYPKRGIMFVLSLGDFTAITRYTMDGRNPTKLRALSGFRPLSLSLDQWSERLFWADAVRDGIASISVKDGTYWPVTIVEGVRTSMQALTAVNNVVHWVTMDDTELRFVYMNEGLIRNIPMNGTSLKSVVQAGSQPDTGLGVCSSPDNGGCGHICVPAGSVATCLCPPGTFLTTDQRTCGL